jgi:hypothetical protein
MKSEFFKLKELVPEYHIKKMGDEAAWGLLHSRLLHTLDTLRSTLGYSMIINTRDMQHRGYRPKGCGVGRSTGAHYLGMAADIDFYSGNKKIDPNRIRKLIMDNRDKFPAIIGIEDEVSWVHIDVMPRPGVPEGKIVLFKPTDGGSVIV